MSFRRQPKNITDLVSSILTDKKFKEKAQSVDFFDRWEEIVGQEYSKCCHPHSLNKGILTVKTIDAVYIQELSMQEKALKKKICDLGFGGTVSNIKFISGNPKNIGSDKQKR